MMAYMGARNQCVDETPMEEWTMTIHDRNQGRGGGTVVARLRMPDTTDRIWGEYMRVFGPGQATFSGEWCCQPDV